MEINSLKTELERVKKDKNITSGLVTQMQRDMANKVMCSLIIIKKSLIKLFSSGEMVNYLDKYYPKY